VINFLGQPAEFRDDQTDFGHFLNSDRSFHVGDEPACTTRRHLVLENASSLAIITEIVEDDLPFAK
jgi:hypothetical protein